MQAFAGEATGLILSGLCKQAGKSTLLRALSNARPKVLSDTQTVSRIPGHCCADLSVLCQVAPYPFTTLRPSIGIVEYSVSH